MRFTILAPLLFASVAADYSYNLSYKNTEAPAGVCAEMDPMIWEAMKGQVTGVLRSNGLHQAEWKKAENVKKRNLRALDCRACPYDCKSGGDYMCCDWHDCCNSCDYTEGYCARRELFEADKEMSDRDLKTAEESLEDACYKALKKAMRSAGGECAAALAGSKCSATLNMW